MPPILRSILAMLAGYTAMAGAIMITFTLVYLVLGAEGSFRPDSWEPSATWMSISIVVGVGAAVLGGWISQLIDSTGMGSKLLIGVVVVLGLVVFGLSYSADPELVRTIESPTSQEAMNNAVQPTWFPFVNIILGVSGVLIAMRLRPSTPSRNREAALDE